MSTVATLTEASVKQFVTDWYRKLDVHVPLEELLPLLTSDVELRLPETTLHGKADFTRWYEGVTNKFFDEEHVIKELDVKISADHADVQLVVNWQAHVWNPPAPNSQWIGFDAGQRWIVKATPENFVVELYVVESFIPMPGSPDL